MKKLLLLLGLSCAMLAGAEAIQDEPLIPDYLKVTIEYDGWNHTASSGDNIFSGRMTGIIPGSSIRKYSAKSHLSDGTPVDKAYVIDIKDQIFYLQSNIWYVSPIAEDEKWVGYDFNNARIIIALTDGGKTWRLYDADLPFIHYGGMAARTGLLCSLLEPLSNYFHDIKLDHSIADIMGSTWYYWQELNAYPRLSNQFDFLFGGISRETFYYYWHDLPYHNNMRNFSIVVDSLTEEEALALIEQNR